MWQITWILSFFPDWFWTLVLTAGVLGLIVSWVLTSIPFILNNVLPIKVFSILMLLVGVYFQGVLVNEEKYKAEHQRLKAEIAAAEAKATETNVDIQKEIVYENRVVKEKGDTVIRYVNRVVKGDPVVITQEVIKERNLGEEERKKLEELIRELQRAEKECPVPTLVIQGINEAAKSSVIGEKK
jgi:glycosyltransferase involved in cell wall biosynthesis